MGRTWSWWSSRCQALLLARRAVHALRSKSAEELEYNYFYLSWILNEKFRAIASLNSELDEELMAFTLVDELWEAIVEYISRVVSGMAMSWPQCPRHPHALTLVCEEQAQWQCRDDPLIFSPVGSLEYLS
jgi:hypothetical protein